MASGIKTGGRSKGTPNKTTKEVRAILKKVIIFELENIETHLNDLTSKERLEILVKLFPYALPKIQNVQATFGEPLDWEID